MTPELKQFFKDVEHPSIDELLRAAETLGREMKKAGVIPTDLISLKYKLNAAIQNRAGFVGKLFFLKSRIITAHQQAAELERKGKDKEAAESFAVANGLLKHFKKIDREAALLMDCNSKLKEIETKVKEAIAARLKEAQADIDSQARRAGIGVEPTIQSPIGGLF